VPLIAGAAAGSIALIAIVVAALWFFVLSPSAVRGRAKAKKQKEKLKGHKAKKEQDKEAKKTKNPLAVSRAAPDAGPAMNVGNPLLQAKPHRLGSKASGSSMRSIGIPLPAESSAVAAMSRQSRAVGTARTAPG
jgi:FtsZ-interacting cell division protein ZipA